MHYLRYSSIKKPKQSVTTPYVTYISHKITNQMTHNYVIISTSLFYFLIYFLFVSKFRLFFENHMVLKKRNVNVFQVVPFLLVAGSYKLPAAGVVPRNRYIS